MKLEPIKLKAEELFFLQEHLEIIHNITLVNFKRLGHEDKLKHSVMLDVSDMVSLRRRTIERKSSIFDPKKKYQLTLKYHEAYLLLNYVSDLDVLDDPHAAMIQRTLIASLDFALQ